MRSNVFKLSAVAATIAASFGAQAAVYKVYSYEPVASSSQTFGVAMETSNDNCWAGTDCQLTQSSAHKMGIEEQRFAQGFSYRDEAPFFYEFGYELLEDDIDGFERYCSSFLGYVDAECDNWVLREYTNGYINEVNGDVENVTAYVESTKIESGQDNVVINSVTPQIGTYYGGSLSKRTIAFSDTPLDIAGTAFTQSKAWEKAGAITVGSVSQPSSYSPERYFKSQAAIWNGSVLTAIPTEGREDKESMPQGSARAITPDGRYAVGYNSTSDEVPLAAVFNLTDLTNIATKFVNTYSDDDVYLNSVLTSVNENNIAIGTAKNRQNPDGVYANILFYVSDITASSLTGNSFSGDIFFSNANGKAGAINNNNEVVGQVDFQRHRESDGVPRSKRAFITVIGDKSESLAPFKNSAYYLDDLTAGDTENNRFRVIDATDINDASVISGTALYCANGYDSEASNALCDGGTPGAEKIVAVKLVPIEGSVASDIQPRATESSKVEREGGSLGWFALGLLALLGFRRK
ncbi:DUF3466 family protein [Vibrio renipiscarius]|uniref:GlyGly-CTERM sorting domain-containing protein n=1 Tax=Vibrio renipiscarius TaxID=1461322 RepID=A0A0C2NHL3_9VIBR|nr:DUF3466 family protein [Vibrio renipiscarius]KII75850.1 hypothetical protein PL18_19345 [Vibrio renipiscarius]KII81700.1 hypothetical protein OJ16_00390 [Vibrio renipiscarius]